MAVIMSKVQILDRVRVDSNADDDDHHHSEIKIIPPLDHDHAVFKGNNFEYYESIASLPRSVHEGKSSSSSMSTNAVQQEDDHGQESGSEKLKKHRNEVAGRRVRIPERWDQEEYLQQWVDFSLFDALLDPKGVVRARQELVAQRQRESTTTGNSCLNRSKPNPSHSHGE